MYKEFIRDDEYTNKKQNIVLFFNEGDIPAKLNVKYNNENYEILAIVDGQKSFYKNNEPLEGEISELYKSDEELDRDLKGELEVLICNWFTIIIMDKDEEEYKTDKVIYSLKELEELSDEEIIDLIETNVKRLKNKLPMNLNDAIEHARLKSLDEELCYECKKEHEQLYKWLCELRDYRTIVNGIAAKYYTKRNFK